jgi:hypothetical protein
VSAYVGGSAAIGLAPGVSVAGAGGARVRVGALSFGLEALASVPRTVEVGDGLGVDVFAVGGALLACGHVDPVSLCARGLVADLVVSGRGLTDARTAHALILALGGRVSAELRPFGPLTIGPFLDLVGVPLGARVREPGGPVFFDTWPAQAAAGAQLGATW